MVKKAGVYYIHRSGTSDYYVGQATDIGDRWRLHRWQLARGIHHSRYLQRAWDKYGSEAFEFGIAQIVKARKSIPAFAKALTEAEQFWMDRYARSYGKQPAYNMAPLAGSNLGIKRSSVTRAKIAERSRKQFESSEARCLLAARGRKQFESAESRAALSETQRKRLEFPRARAAISAGVRRHHEAFPETGAAHSRFMRERFEALSATERSALREAVLNGWTPKARRAQSDRLREILVSPEARAANSARALKRMASPEARALLADSAREYWESPEARAAAAARGVKQFESPEARAAMAESVRKTWTPEARAVQSARAQKQFETPEARSSASDRSRKAWESPEVRAAHWSARWSPEARATRAARAARASDA
jgi:group I intron endonuclease